MAATAFLVVVSFTFLGISSSLFSEQHTTNHTHIKWSDDKKSFVVFPVNRTFPVNDFLVRKVKTSCKDVDGNDLCTTVGKFSNIFVYSQNMRRRRAAEKVKSLTTEKSSAKENVYFVADASSACFVPQLDTAEIRCKLLPSSIICKSYCIYGYTYEEGIERTLSCKFSENRWTPYFEECTPFIDCYLKLVTPGSLKCWGNKVNESPKCEIQCDIYEDQDPLPKQVYKCKTDGTWEPFMPFCVQPKGLKQLANFPGQVEHNGLPYP